MDEDLALRKLVAFLHDPPEKPYDYGPVHHERAKHYLSTILGQDLGVLEQGGVLKREPDWEAAAADRFPFPDGKKLNQAGLPPLSGGLAYKHPFTGKTVLEKAKFPQEDQAWEAINSVLPNFEAATNADRFWALWRLWRQYVMEKNWPLGYLPADTRIPDGTIWHHMAVVSGFESTRSNWEASCQPAFFLLQIGPVQEFIAQARTTRDLWSGSYLLSWMIAKVAYELAERYGPDTVIYPSLWGQPLYDWLNRERLQQLSYGRRNSWEALKLDEKEKQGLVTVPNFPNKILAWYLRISALRSSSRRFSLTTKRTPSGARSAMPAGNSLTRTVCCLPTIRKKRGSGNPSAKNSGKGVGKFGRGRMSPPL
jgi:hypothetical protein